jgi:hypothetical protein
MIEEGVRMELSVIIVSWNTRQILEDCLKSIYSNPPAGDFEILVIDNYSSDGSAEMIRALFPQARLVVNTSNLGFAGANNQGIRLSQGRYVLLLNSDTQVKPGAFETLLRFMDQNPKVGVSGARLFNQDGSLQVSCFPEPTLGREIWRLFHMDRLRPLAVYPMDTWPLDRPQYVHTLLGACLLIRHEVLDQVGLMDEGYFMYSEEVDLCHRIQRAGWLLAWVPQAQIIHYGGQSTKQVAQDMFLRLYRGKIRYFRKNNGWLAAQAYKLILIAASLGRLMLTPLVVFERPAKRRQHLILSGNYCLLLATLPGM